MVYYALLVGAELDGLTNLQPRRGCDDPNFPYYLKLKCENCGEVTAKSTYVTLSEQVDLPKGHGTAHLVQKCKLCGRDGTIVMIPGHGTPLTIEQSQKEEKTCLMVFDCRGYEPVEFSFGDGWKAESFARLYPLDQKDMTPAHRPIDFGVPVPTGVEVETSARDYTPPQYLTLLLTDLGVLTPSVVSDELIQLYL